MMQPTLLFYNFTAAVSGAEVILLDLIGGITAYNRENPAQSYRLVLVCPSNGPLWERAAAIAGLELVAIRPLQVGYTRNPLVLARYVGQLLGVGFDLLRIVRHYQPVVLHANAVRAGLVACLIAPLARTAVIVHLHDKLGTRSTDRVIRTVLGSLAWKLTAISDYTNQAFTQAKPRLKRKCITIYNGVDVGEFDPARFDRAATRTALLAQWPRSTAPAEVWPLLGIVGQLTPWKGHQTALEALELLVKMRQTAPNAGLIIVGGLKFALSTARYDNAAFYRELTTFIEAEGLQNHVWFCGERDDIPQLMQSLDILLLPSWYEPFGRVVVEAMAMERVVVASAEGGPLEIIENGISGRLYEVKNAAALAQTIQELIADRSKMLQIGRQARQRVLRKFSSTVMVKAFLDVYAQVSNGRSNVRK